MAAGKFENFGSPEAEMTYEAQPGFVQDERGAVMVFGLFASAFLVGTVWYMVSIGTTLMQREGLQHTADATAFGSAVQGAKAMNMIAAINVLMAGMESILMPVRDLEAPYAHTAARHAAPCALGSAIDCAIMEDAERGGAEDAALLAELEPIGKQVNQMLSQAQVQIATMAPRLAAQAANNLARENAAFLRTPQAEMFSPSLAREGCKYGLPVEDDTWKRACKHGKSTAVEFENRLIFEKFQTDLAGPETFAEAAGQASSIDERMCEQMDSPCGGQAQPKKVYSRAKNGSDYMQWWTRVEGKQFQQEESRVAATATWENGKRASDPAQESNVGFAQAELYFDCQGGWSSSSCNSEEHAMWSGRWTARLRRIKSPNVSFPGDAIVRTEIASPTKWNQVRQQLLQARNTPWGRGGSSVSGLLNSSEGPLQ